MSSVHGGLYEGCKKTIDDFGFTLVEMMIALAMSGFLIIAIYSAYNLQQRTYYSQEQVIEVQQNIRAGLDSMIRELRMAGYDPLQTGVPGIVAASSASINFTLDIDNDTGDGDGDGDVDDTNESVTYDLNGSTLRRNNQAIAENIQAIEFYYTVDDGVNVSQTLTPATLADIRSIQISILAIARQRDADYIHSDTYTTASGASWGPYNDNFRRRFFVTTVQCRNMGLL